jgi:hydroxypyruvate reductase
MGVDADGEQHGASGMGGRNQQFSLYAASLLESSDACTVVLSAGSDGIDGNSPAAGAVIDEWTLRPMAGQDLGAEARSALERFDSYRFLKRMGNMIVTGATGNNLRDLRILLADRPS